VTATGKTNARNPYTRWNNHEVDMPVRKNDKILISAAWQWLHPLYPLYDSS